MQVLVPVGQHAHHHTAAASLVTQYKGASLVTQYKGAAWNFCATMFYSIPVAGTSPSVEGQGLTLHQAQFPQ